mmetsp:Transcript_27104/g.57208  ORF Transcript_27104/g.57208 Transcript_27104/m.57208 type:complete len:260 (+) Transcript_27104:220-999(+)
MATPFPFSDVGRSYGAMRKVSSPTSEVETDNDSPFAMYGCGIFWPQPGSSASGADTNIGNDEMRMPEISSPGSSPCSPGTRQGDADMGIMHSMSAWCSPTESGSPSSSPGLIRSTPKIPRKNSTAAEAYNKGMLLQYIIESCSDLDCRKLLPNEKDYEAKWNGHQPLSPETWTCTTDSCNDASENVISASEMRLMRSRRRRGVMSPLRLSNGEVDCAIHLENNVFSEASIPSKSQDSSFPADVVDPHLVVKKKWVPNCE